MGGCRSPPGYYMLIAGTCALRLCELLLPVPELMFTLVMEAASDVLKERVGNLSRLLVPPNYAIKQTISMLVMGVSV